MALDVDSLASGILTAMKGVFQNKWPELKGYAGGEAKKMAHSLTQIAALKASGQINEGEASILLEMQRNATRQVFLTIEGMGLLLVEQAINAALEAVKGVVNNAIGFALL
jgi:hypothetical protein